MGLHLHSLWGIHWLGIATSLPSLWIEASLTEALLVMEASLCLDQSPKYQGTIQAMEICTVNRVVQSNTILSLQIYNNKLCVLVTTFTDLIYFVNI